MAMTQTGSSNRIEEVERLLRQRLRGQVACLRVLVRDEQVVLQGRACRYYVKQLAQVVVLQEMGNTVLVNEIEVVPAEPRDETAEK
jgi:hypothetical protein